MNPLAQRVLAHIVRDQLLEAGERVGVAVSGGVDSVALLRLLLECRSELGIVLSVVHFNHQLRGAESDADQAFVAGLAAEYGLEFCCDGRDVARRAAEERVSTEAAARELRYAFFRRLLGARESQAPTPHTSTSIVPSPERSLLQKVVTGHTLDDQAETVLLRAIRGTGLRGLAGIYPRIAVEDESGEVCGEIVRPLLATRRRDLESYLRETGQSWREDTTNLSTKFTRNRVRHILLPLLEKEFNPATAETLADIAEIARGEEDYWENEVEGWMGTGVHWSEPAWAGKSELVQIRAGGARTHVQSETAAALESRIGNVPWRVMNASVDRLWLLGEPLAVQRRIVKSVGDQARIPLDFKHVDEIVRFAGKATGSGSEISLPMGWKVRCDPHQIIFVTPDLRETEGGSNYEYELPVPGEVMVSEIGSIVEARRISADAGYNSDHLLDAQSLQAGLKVRNWRAGDRFWPRHTKSPRKIKELLQERHVPQPERWQWPVIVSAGEIVWMRGFSVGARFAAKAGREAIAIVERSLSSETVDSGR